MARRNTIQRSLVLEAVFFAEPVSDVLAAAVTTVMFFRFFIRLLKKEKPAL